MHELLTDTNFLQYCAKHYDFKRCINEEEFHDDLNRIRYIKKLLTRYKQTGELKERLILNHLIVLNNVFGPHHCSRIIFLKFKDIFSVIKPFLVLLNLCPEKYINVGKPNSVNFTDDYPLDSKIVDKLRQI